MTAMERYAGVRGTRAEILKELDTMGRDRCDQGGERNAAKAEIIGQAWQDIRDGAQMVRVGHTEYWVTEG